MKRTPKKDKQNMVKTTIELPSEQYRFLRDRAFEQRAEGGSNTVVSVIRKLVATDMKKRKKTQKRNDS